MLTSGMQFNEELIFVRDTEATVIPSGDTQVIPAGTHAVISQALGGTVTIRTDSGLFRLSSQDWDALGVETQAQLDQIAKDDELALGDVPFSEELVWEAMKGCFDPEIPVNIVDLGLIYDLKITHSRNFSNLSSRASRSCWNQSTHNYVFFQAM